MTARRVSGGVLAAGLAMLSGCGGSSQREASLARLPLVPGSRVSVRERVCDTGANAYCGWELVVVNRRFRDANAFFEAQHRLLLQRRWSGAQGDTGNEHAADSPGHKLRLTYAPPTSELQAVDLGWVRRSQAVTLALSRAIFEHAPALAMLLEPGSS